MDADEHDRLVERVRRVRHDAGNPLTAALGSVQLLLSDPEVRDPEIRAILGEVERELHRLSQILRELHDVQPLGESERTLGDLA